MKIERFSCIVCLLICLIAAGCAFKRPAPPITRDPAIDNRPPNRYFYFTEAQLARKYGKLDKAAALLEKALAADPTSIYMRKELAKIYLQGKQGDKALQQVEQVLTTRPEDVEALIIYGRIKQGQKHYADAAKAYSKVIDTDPQRKEIYIMLGSMLMDEENWDAAMEVYDRLIAAFPDYYIGYFLRGKIFVEQNKLQEATVQFETTIKLEPALEEPRFELIGIHRKLNQNNRILALYQEMLAENPDRVRANLGLAYFYHRTGSKALAKNLTNKLGRQSRNNPEVFRTLFKRYIETKQYDAAIVLIKGMLKVVPQSSELNYLAGVAYDGKDNKAEAAEHFLAVQPESRFFSNATVHLAFYYQEQGNIEKAIAFLQDVITKVPDNPEFYLYLGSFHEETQAYQSAEAALKDGLEVEPNNGRLWFRLGVVYDKWGRKEDSIATMKQVLQIEPENANALNYLGYTYADLGMNLDEAEALIIRALKQKPNDGYITDSLGWVYYKKGQYEKAVRILERAAELVPDDPVILEHVGDAYMKLNDHQKALEFYRRALKHQKKDKAPIERKIREISNTGI